MAKRELSTTLRNLKFMQRGPAAQKPPISHKGEDAQNEQIDKTNQNSPFTLSSLPSRKCTVIIEGNPHPAALKGRMSFGSFNPSIDKLNEAALTNHQIESSPSTPLRIDRSESRSQQTQPDLDLKRKMPTSETENPSPSKLQKNKNGDTGTQPASSNEHSGNRSGGFKKPLKRDKLDWNILRPPRKQ